MATHQRVELGYEPRVQFVDFHKRKQRWAVLVCHRRAGKTVSAIMDLVDHALRCTKPDGRFAYVAPLFVQARDVAWAYLKNFALKVPGTVSNEVDLRVDFPNGSRVRLYGSDSYERMRGLYFDGVVLDEVADFDPRAYPEVIRPALADRLGFAVFLGTPKGRNAFFDLRETARQNPDWFYLELLASETGLLPESELADARSMMTPEQYAQEFECSFNAAIVGAYYGKEIAQAERQGRICVIERIPGLPVYTAFDLGIGDSTAIWVFQIAINEIRILDHIENHSQPLSWYVTELNSRGWNAEADFLPQDAKVRSLETGRTRVETLHALGRNPRLVPAHKLEDGVNALRITLPRMWFNAGTCEYGLECLRQYRAEYDEKAKVFRDRPKHDWTSHTADAARYLAIAYRELVPTPQKSAPPPPNQITVNDLLKHSKPERKWA